LLAKIQIKKNTGYCTQPDENKEKEEEEHTVKYFASPNFVVSIIVL